MSKSAQSASARAAEEQTTRSPLARIVTAIVLVLASVHMFFTGVVNVPYPDIKYGALPGEAADSYVNPLLTQNYRIFAPNPASEDRSLWVRAWVELDDGTRVETEWINATAVELAVPYRKILRKHLTINAAERYMAAYRGLNEEQREIISSSNFHREGDRERMEQLLTDAGPAAEYLRIDEYLTAFSTQVALALYGDEAEILGVQSRVVYNPVVRWNDRNDPNAEPPPSRRTHEGWREPIVNAGQDSEAFARSFLQWMDRLEGDR
ncbi:MAG TPA: hypothetical protein H9830_13345 [Candidatus Agrococcus pullicola]|uniref:Uncharacterized protein n=1 Tax=Candidatus Agrococcus pullicola TaxID=2838429 RepID=A0A9D2CAX4_9MICO|nr:hypothetical protein [Candidatus Agrococcus pullicola]